ncbi:MAG: hypothetical protein DRO94_00540 [Candidatus Altiarchaeales archaeon]|nr:MAG: hypothetical protein DRO94_00540 [Candidatus Altiarchaeales archaeon]
MKVIILKVFVCTCRDTINLPKDLNFGDGIDVEKFSNLCSDDGIKRVAEVVEKGEKVVIAGCSPRIADRYFGEFNPEYVNIREQVAHIGHSPEKINSLINGAIQKLRNSEDIEEMKFEIKERSVLVIGGGVAGLEAARQIANSGIKVYLIEKKPFLGGVVGTLDRLYPKGTPNSHNLYSLINDIAKNENIEVITNSELEKVGGEFGNYNVLIRVRGNVIEDCDLCGRCEEVCPVEVEDHGLMRKAIYYMPTYPDNYGIDFDSCTKCGKCLDVCNKLSLGEKERILNVGAIVVATGLKQYDVEKVKGYGYKKLRNVFTHWDFERKFASGEINPGKVVIIHCAGSRDDNHLAYCSRICCFLGLKEAKLIKDVSPETDVTVCYIDMRSYGVFDELYETLRRNHGVKFINGRPAEILENGNKLKVRTEDILLGKPIELDADCVILSTGFVPDAETFEKLNIKCNGEFPTAYVNSILSDDSNPHGVYICGSAAFPKGVSETISEARDIAMSIVNLLNNDSIKLKTPIARINGKICGAIDCRICVDTCPYGAVYLNEDGEVGVNESICMGCGICTATCASGANQLYGFDDRGILAQVEATINEGDIAAFLCKWSSYNAADNIAYKGLNYPENVKIMRIPCTGRIDAQTILKAFSSGAKSVLIAGCPPDACHYNTGNFKARKRVIALREMLGQFNIDPERLRIEWIGNQEAERLVRILNEMNK